MQLCLEERVGQLTGEVAVHVKEKQELQAHAMTIKNLWRTMEQVKQLGGKVSSHVESKQGLQKHVQELEEHLQGVVVRELGQVLISRKSKTKDPRVMLCSWTQRAC